MGFRREDLIEGHWKWADSKSAEFHTTQVPRFLKTKTGHHEIVSRYLVGLSKSIHASMPRKYILICLFDLKFLSLFHLTKPSAKFFEKLKPVISKFL